MTRATNALAHMQCLWRWIASAILTAYFHRREMMVELSGIEPLTSSLRTTRSPN